MRALLALAVCLLSAIPVAADAPAPWHLGEATALRTWWWGEVPKVPTVAGDGYAACVPVRPGLRRCVVVSQGHYRRIVVNGVVWEDRRQRTHLPMVRAGRPYHQWLPAIFRGTR